MKTPNFEVQDPQEGPSRGVGTRWRQVIACCLPALGALLFTLSALAEYAIDWSTADGGGATSTGGVKPKLYKRFEGQKWSAQSMSVAVTNDRHLDHDPA